MAAAFHLSKWYMDCVDGDGRVFLAYRADLRWGKLRLHYASVPGRAASLHETPAPVLDRSALRWSSPALEIEACWEAIDPPVRETLRNGIDWNCLMPRARAEVRFRNERFSGLGYAECLTISIPPWRLPIEELRWGRLLAESHGLVWIEWRGPEPLRLVFHNGAKCETADLPPLSESITLRDGTLLETLLPAIPAIDRLFPASILRVRETKWRSRGTLGGEAGWAIHEVVRWPS